MLDAPVGVERVPGRHSRPRNAPTAGPDAALVPESMDGPVRAGLRRVAAAARLLPHPARRPPRSRGARPAATLAMGRVLRTVGPERIVASSVVAIVLIACGLSLAPADSTAATPLVLTGAVAGDLAERDADDSSVARAPSRDVALAGPVGGTRADEAGPRIVVGGGSEMSTSDIVYGAQGSSRRANTLAKLRPVALSDDVLPVAPEVETLIPGLFLEDGTLLKPVAVDTTVADGRALLRTYKIRSGDTVAAIAKRHGVSLRTIWWANDLKSLTSLPTGKILTIPPVSGLLVVVGATDTLATLAATYRIEGDAILAANQLTDPNLVVGQVLVLPDAVGTKALPKRLPVARPSVSGRSVSPPTRYNGGAFAWPVAGGYISQYFRYGHYGLDIAADRGTMVKAAAGGTVIFAGWKSNGGGYQVWLAHGSNLYTTYNHMSGVSVGQGQSVGRGQQVGRVGSSGFSSGPHLHFEVWRGMIWQEGRRVNPLAYL